MASAYTAVYGSGDIATAIIDVIVAIVAGLVGGNNAFLVGGAIAITIVILLYTNLLGRVMHFLQGFMASAMNMSHRSK